MNTPRVTAPLLAATISFAVLLGFAGCATKPTPPPPSTAVTTTPTPVPVAPTAAAPVPKPVKTEPTPVPVTEIPVPVAPTPEPAPIAPVTPPPTPIAAPVDNRPATILGSEETSTMLDNLTVYVTSVNGQALSIGRDGWNIPLKLRPGKHRLGVAFSRGVFVARADIELEAKPAAAYQLKFATDAQIFGKNSYCEFWIVESGSDTRLAQSGRVSLTRAEKNGR